MKKISILILFTLLVSAVLADTYWIQFKDKQGTADIDNPSAYLSNRAIERREKYFIAVDSLDLPISPVYTDSLTKMGCQIAFVSRWLNGVTAEIPSTEILQAVQELDFVGFTERTRKDNNNTILRANKYKLPAAVPPLVSTDLQINQINLSPLHQAGFKGQDILMAIIDDGFCGVDNLPAFAAARERIIDTHDFVNTPTYQDVYCHKNTSEGDHGTMVFSTIAAQTEGFNGTATEAHYILLRTEDDYKENLREMDALVAAMEFADSAGVDICSISLGYLDAFDDSSTNPVYSMMDGKTMRSSIAATIAARKGMLICVAAGNEGNKSWHYIDTPADADSILTVGGVDQEGNVVAFSSYGPTADGRQKPEVSALASSAAIINTSGKITTSSGTSFSTPIMAGAVACLWSALPKFNNIEIRNRVIESASKLTTPNNHIGYGIPNMWNAYNGATDITDIDQHTTIGSDAMWYDILGNPIRNTQHLKEGVYIIKEKSSTKKVLLK